MLQPGLMMDRPLLISDVIEHAAAKFGYLSLIHISEPTRPY